MPKSKNTLNRKTGNPPPSVIYQTRGPIGEIIFNRPEVLNALNEEMGKKLRESLEQCAHDPAIRCVIIRSSGRAFMAGGDIDFFQSVVHLDSPQRQNLFRKLVQEAHASILAIKGMPKPVIASIRGATAGFGVSLMMACDIVIAGTSSSLTLAYNGLGLSPDGGATYSLARSIGLRKAMELFLLGEHITGINALNLGLVTKLVPDECLDAETNKIAEKLANGPTLAFAKTKALLDQSLNNNLSMQLAAEEEAFSNSTTTTDFIEGVSAFLEKRPAVFTGK